MVAAELTTTRFIPVSRSGGFASRTDNKQYVFAGLAAADLDAARAEADQLAGIFGEPGLAALTGAPWLSDTASVMCGTAVATRRHCIVVAVHGGRVHRKGNF